LSGLENLDASSICRRVVTWWEASTDRGKQAPPLQDPALPQSMTFCTDKYADGQAPPLMILMRSAREEVEPIAQQLPLHICIK
jgi:hypothetical protein